MKPARVALGVVGLAAFAALAVPLTQRLSIDSRSFSSVPSFIDERQSPARLADSFETTPATQSLAIGFGPLWPYKAAPSRADQARARRVPIDTGKQRIAELVVPRQFANDSILADVGLGSRPEPAGQPH